jgi:hypothetical protein
MKSGRDGFSFAPERRELALQPLVLVAFFLEIFYLGAGVEGVGRSEWMSMGVASLVGGTNTDVPLTAL